MISDLISNKLLISSLAGWTAAEVIKTLIDAIINKKITWSRLVGDGGMPSAHSATVTALATSAGIIYGLASPVFAVTLIVAIITMHDAMGVRLEASKHAKALNEIIEFLSEEKDPDIILNELLGHTPLQVICGSILGFIIAIILI